MRAREQKISRGRGWEPPRGWADSVDVGALIPSRFADFASDALFLLLFLICACRLHSTARVCSTRLFAARNSSASHHSRRSHDALAMSPSKRAASSEAEQFYLFRSACMRQLASDTASPNTIASRKMTINALPCYFLGQSPPNS